MGTTGRRRRTFGLERLDRDFSYAAEEHWVLATWAHANEPLRVPRTQHLHEGSALQLRRRTEEQRRDAGHHSARGELGSRRIHCRIRRILASARV